MAAKKKAPENMHVVRTERQVVDALEYLGNASAAGKIVGLDTESSGPNLVHLGSRRAKTSMLNVHRSTLTGISLSSQGKSFYLPVAHVEGQYKRTSGSRAIASNASIPLVRKTAEAVSHFGIVGVHNLKHELLALSVSAHTSLLAERWRALLRHGGYKALVCTQVACWLAGLDDGQGRFGLKGLAKRHFGVDRPGFQETTGGRAFSELTPEEGLEYACQDAVDAEMLAELALPRIDSWGLSSWFWDVEMPTVALLRHVEDAGMGLDAERIHALDAEYRARMEELEEEWAFETDGVSLTSGPQLQTLYEKKVWTTRDVGKTAGGVWQTDTKAVDAQLRNLPSPSLGYRLAEIKQEYALLAKNSGTYCQKLLDKAEQYDDLRLHGGMNQTGTATGRYSSSYPNLQNIPVRTEEGKRIREAFRPAPGRVLLSADYSQIELRVLAHMAGGGTLYNGFHMGVDPHQATGDALGVDRDGGKTGNFAIVYGAGAKKVASSLKITVPEAKAFLEKMQTSLAEEYAALMKKSNDAERLGYVRTIAGRRRVIETAKYRSEMDSLRAAGANYKTSEEYRECWYNLGREERRARNTPVQGSAADIVKKAMLDMWRQLDLSQTSLICQVHDDILQEPLEEYADEAAEIQERCMVEAWNLKVPLVADVARGGSWAELKG